MTLFECQHFKDCRFICSFLVNLLRCQDIIFRNLQTWHMYIVHRCGYTQTLISTTCSNVHTVYCSVQYNIVNWVSSCGRITYLITYTTYYLSYLSLITLILITVLILLIAYHIYLFYLLQSH